MTDQNDDWILKDVNDINESIYMLQYVMPLFGIKIKETF